MCGMTEADTCRKFTLPKLIQAGWDREPHSFTEQRTLPYCRIIVSGGEIRLRDQKCADRLPWYTRYFPKAVVETKAEYKSGGDGFEHAKEHAKILDLSFAYTGNRTSVTESDFLSSPERGLDAYPKPGDLWKRLLVNQGLTDNQTSRLSTLSYLEVKRRPRYCQKTTFNRAVQAIMLRGKR